MQNAKQHVNKILHEWYIGDMNVRSEITMLLSLNEENVNVFFEILEDVTQHLILNEPSWNAMDLDLVEDFLLRYLNNYSQLQGFLLDALKHKFVQEYNTNALVAECWKQVCQQRSELVYERYKHCDDHAFLINAISGLVAAGYENIDQILQSLVTSSYSWPETFQAEFAHTLAMYLKSEDRLEQYLDHLCYWLQNGSLAVRREASMILSSAKILNKQDYAKLIPLLYANMLPLCHNEFDDEEKSHESTIHSLCGKIISIVTEYYPELVVPHLVQLLPQILKESDKQYLIAYCSIVTYSVLCAMVLQPNERRLLTQVALKYFDLASKQLYDPSMFSCCILLWNSHIFGLFDTNETSLACQIMCSIVKNGDTSTLIDFSYVPTGYQ